MSKKSEGLPELVIKSGGIVLDAQNAMIERGKAAEATARETQAKDKVREGSKKIRQDEVGKNNFIGLLRIVTGDKVPPVRVEFRIENGALDVSEEPKLDQLFGGSRPVLFEKSEVVTEITDPEGLVNTLRKAGLNPWDMLRLSVKSDALCGITGVKDHLITATALLPKPGFLATINGIVKSLSAEAVDYVKKYLDQVTEPRVVLGTKAKGD